MQPDPMNPGQITWTVGVQTVTTKLDASGSPVVGYTVPFTLSSGHTDSVWVPADDYTVDGVRQAIAGKAAEIAAVFRLSGQV
jgi:hypothetical protein